MALFDDHPDASHKVSEPGQQLQNQFGKPKNANFLKDFNAGSFFKEVAEGNEGVQSRAENFGERLGDEVNKAFKCAMCMDSQPAETLADSLPKVETNVLQQEELIRAATDRDRPKSELSDMAQYGPRTDRELSDYANKIGAMPSPQRSDKVTNFDDVAKSFLRRMVKGTTPVPGYERQQQKPGSQVSKLPGESVQPGDEMNTDQPGRTVDRIPGASVQPHANEARNGQPGSQRTGSSRPSLLSKVLPGDEERQQPKDNGNLTPRIPNITTKKKGQR